MVAKYPLNGRPRPRPDSPGPRPFKPHRPDLPGWPKRPIPKIPPLPKSSVTIAKNAFRGIGRAVPYLGAAITAYEIYDYISNNPPHMVFGGWILQQMCPSGQYPFRYRGTGTVNCSVVLPLGTGLPLPVPANLWGGLQLIAPKGVNASYRGVHSNWYRPIAYANVPAQPWPIQHPNPEPFPWTAPRPVRAPKLSPFELPIGRPVPQPKTAPRPVGRPKPGEQPSERPAPQGKPRPGKLNRPEFHRIPTLPFPLVTFPQPTTGSPIVPVQPEQVLIVPKPPSGPPGRGNGRLKPRIRENPNRARNRPRKKREKEQKVNVRTVSGGLWGLINVFTEGLDFLDVLYDATPEPCKAAAKSKAQGAGYPNYIPPHFKAQAVYNCFGDIDVGQAIENYVNNQIEDMVYGMIGQALGKASKNFNMSTGLNRAMKEHMDRTTGDGGIDDFIPQIDIDENGDINIVLPTAGSVNVDGKVNAYGQFVADNSRSKG